MTNQPSKKNLARADLRQMAQIWFGLRPFMSGTWSAAGHQDDRMDLGLRIPLTYKAISLARWMRRNHKLFAKQESALHDKALHRLRSQLPAGGVGEPKPLPEVSADIDPEEFRERFVKNPHPVIIRGLANDLPAVKRWNKAFFEEQCGDTKVHVYDADYETEGDELSYREFETTVREALNTPGVYLDTNREVFVDHPWLNDDIAPLEEWRPYLGRATYLASQVFMGLQADGAPLHCANQWNFFIMVDGQKEWTLVSPEYSFQIGAVGHPTAITFEGCATGKGGTWRDDHPLFKDYCPRFKAVVNKGDVLLNPPWWWHEIKNTSDFSIGISSRWLVEEYPHTNSLFDLKAFLSPDMWRLKLYFLEKYGAEAEMAAAGEKDLLRELVNREQPKHKHYYEDFIRRSEQKVFD